MNYKYVIKFLIVILAILCLAIFSVDTNLHVIACNVGQGDAILIQRNTTQILIDGGPNKSVLDCLGRYMPFWDKTIELVILTHPEQDHYEGLIDVFKMYKVVNFGQYNTKSGSQGYQLLRNEVGSHDTQSIVLTTGTNLRVGLMQLDILHPNLGEYNSNTNDDGVVTLLKYGQFEALFTADVEDRVSDELSKNTKIQNLDYIKVNHHGSKNGMSQNLLNVVNPKIAVISAGFKNRYGHPHAEIMEMLNNKKIEILRTDLIGDVEVITNDTNFWTKK